MAFDPITAAVNLGTQLIDKFIADPGEKERAKIELLKQSQSGELKKIELGLSAIIAEAKSSDKWTSRARPSFLYVMYIMILFSIPMGILSAFRPEIAFSISEGMKFYLSAIPKEMWTLFGAGFLGYVGSRSYDKKKRQE